MKKSIILIMSLMLSACSSMSSLDDVNESNVNMYDNVARQSAEKDTYQIFIFSAHSSSTLGNFITKNVNEIDGNRAIKANDVAVLSNKEFKAMSDSLVNVGFENYILFPTLSEKNPTVLESYSNIDYIKSVEIKPENDRVKESIITDTVTDGVFLIIEKTDSPNIINVKIRIDSLINIKRAYITEDIYIELPELKTFQTEFKHKSKDRSLSEENSFIVVQNTFSENRTIDPDTWLLEDNESKKNSMIIVIVQR